MLGSTPKLDGDREGPDMLFDDSNLVKTRMRDIPFSPREVRSASRVWQLDDDAMFGLTPRIASPLDNSWYILR